MRKATSFLLMTALAATIAAPAPSFAQTTSASSGGFSLLDSIGDYFSNWFVRSDRAKATQPHWMTPLVTGTPRLEQELRYDQSFQSAQYGQETTNFGSGKGLELIPWETVELILGIPNYVAHEYPGKKGKKNRGTDGFADWTSTIKYRLLSANEENGNYILTLSMVFSAPTGQSPNSQGHAIFTPTISFGKGWGDFDFQSTVSCAFPNGGLDRLGMPVAYNTAFQYHLFKFFWPEFEVNYTWWPDGNNAGKNQVFLTPGLILGRFPLYDRFKLVAGAGFQVAVTKFNQYHNSWVITGRIPF
ncbi:MAG TPA: hypothetical protein VEF03_11635 [Candidatus Binataceae bacterium]|nr:hypothetical protein [Candidatus Binataceae bacterium]